MGKEGVTLHEARLHRQDLQIQKLMEDMDNLNQNYMRYRNLLMEFQSRIRSTSSRDTAVRWLVIR